jgi:hypothetical protein
MTLDETHLGWLGSDDYAVAAELRRQRDRRDPDRPDADRPDDADVRPRRDLFGELLAGRWSDDEPPTAPR